MPEPLFSPGRHPSKGIEEASLSTLLGLLQLLELLEDSLKVAR